MRGEGRAWTVLGLFQGSFLGLPSLAFCTWDSWESQKFGPPSPFQYSPQEARGSAEREGKNGDQVSGNTSLRGQATSHPGLTPGSLELTDGIQTALQSSQGQPRYGGPPLVTPEVLVVAAEKREEGRGGLQKE